MIARKKGSLVAAVTAVCAVFLCIAAADGAMWLRKRAGRGPGNA